LRAERRGARHLFVLPWLFAFAKKVDDDGRLSVDGHPAEPVDIAYGMPCITTKEVERGLAELEDIGVLTRDDDGALRFTSWDRRSGHAKPSDEPDAVRQRVAKHRARRKHGDVTPRNASDVTPGNGGELELEIEQEIEQEREQDGNAAHTRDGDSIAAEKTLAESLRNTAGDHWPDVRRFLESRKRETRPAWIREMAKLIGPGSQFSSADLAGACADALALEEPLSGPHALRAFIAKCALERTSATTAAAIGGPGRGHNAHESIQLVGQIKAAHPPTRRESIHPAQRSREDGRARDPRLRRCRRRRSLPLDGPQRREVLAPRLQAGARRG
jgi:hypothetical protein